MKLVLAILLTLFATWGFSATSGEKITICHATGSETNPYVEIEVSINAHNGHFDNEGNHLEGHEDDFLGECPVNPSESPIPSQSVTPTESPTPLPTETTTESPSETPIPSNTPENTITPSQSVEPVSEQSGGGGPIGEFINGPLVSQTPAMFPTASSVARVAGVTLTSLPETGAQNFDKLILSLFVAMFFGGVVLLFKNVN